jgi:hypothetical protein
MKKYKVVFVDGTMTTVVSTTKEKAMGLGTTKTGKVPISAKVITKAEFDAYQ